MRLFRTKLSESGCIGHPRRSAEAPALSADVLGLECSFPGLKTWFSVRFTPIVPVLWNRRKVTSKAGMEVCAHGLNNGEGASPPLDDIAGCLRSIRPDLCGVVNDRSCDAECSVLEM
ncbi:hypothetical protein AB1N83_007330 [Pleurotus pulmonarius]